MDAELSRRAGRALSSKFLLQQTLEERSNFRMACEQAKTVTSLPQKWKNILDQAEKSLLSRPTK